MRTLDDVTVEEFRAVMDKQIQATTDPDRKDDLIMVREFYTNPAFRKALSDMVWETLEKKERTKSSNTQT